MFDGSHNSAITFLCAEGSVQANISSDVLPMANFIRPAVQPGALCTRSLWVKKQYDHTLSETQRLICVRPEISLSRDITIIAAISGTGVCTRNPRYPIIFGRGSVKKLYDAVNTTEKAARSHVRAYDALDASVSPPR